MTETTNLLFLLGESHSRALVGAYGHPIIQTPNLDKLAARGAIFENSYCASPICVPARAAIATGQYPHENRYWENSIALDGEADTWMKQVRSAGHEVVGIGKFHYRNETDDNGYSRQIIPMHIVDGVGELIGLLRSSGEEPQRPGLWKLYTDRAGVGEETVYKKYDKSVSAEAVKWLTTEGKTSEKPWALSVHYVSAHAPYTVPQELFDLYPLDRIQIPPGFEKATRPDHPANQHLRNILGQADDLDEAMLRKIIACYYATITYLDRELGKVLDALEEAGLSETTRVIYTGDHGYSAGENFVFGLFNLYETGVGVPLIMAGPGIPEGRRVKQIVSHVDLYPTILEGFGIPPESDEGTRTGRSLWPALRGEEADVPGFAEYHALGTKTGSFLYRRGSLKLLYHVDMPPQLFDLATDPGETNDLAGDPAAKGRLEEMLAGLRDYIDPEAVDALAKADQQAFVDRLGGKDEIIRLRDGFVYSPPPNHDWQKM